MNFLIHYLRQTHHSQHYDWFFATSPIHDRNWTLIRHLCKILDASLVRVIMQRRTQYSVPSQTSKLKFSVVIAVNYFRKTLHRQSFNWVLNTPCGCDFHQMTAKAAARSTGGILIWIFHKIPTKCPSQNQYLVNLQDWFVTLIKVNSTTDIFIGFCLIFKIQ